MNDVERARLESLRCQATAVERARNRREIGLITRNGRSSGSSAARSPSKLERPAALVWERADGNNKSNRKHLENRSEMFPF